MHPDKILPLWKWVGIPVFVIGLSLLALWFVFTYTTTYPLAIDEWLHFVPRNLAFRAHTLSFSQALSMTSEFGDAPPSLNFYGWLVTLPNVILFDWNLQIDSLTNCVLIVVNILLTLYLFASTRSSFLIYLIVPVTALMLAIQQRWNLLVSIHNGIHLQLLFALLTFVLISRQPCRVRNILLAAIMALAGTFAYLIGWLTWIIVLPALWLLGYRQKSVYLIWLIGTGLAAFILISIPGFSIGEGHYAISTEVTGGSLLITYVLFFVTWIGAVFNGGPASNVLISMLMGMLGLLVFISNIIILWRRREDRDYLVVCIMVGAYSLALGGLTTLARSSELGVRWAMTHHYISFSVLFWISVGAVITLMFHRVDWHRRSFLTFLNLFVILMGVLFYFYGVYSTIKIVEEHTALVRNSEMCIERTASQPAENPVGCDVVGGIALTEWIVRLHDSGLTGFADRGASENGK